MRLYFDLNLGKFITQSGYVSSASVVEAKVGAGEPLEIEFSRDGQLEDLPETAEMRFGLKDAGNYDGELIASVESSGFTKVAGKVGLYVAVLNLNGSAIRGLLGIDGNITNDKEFVMVMGQLDWRAAAGDNWAKSAKLDVKIFNSVLRDTDGMEEDPVPDYPTAQEVVDALMQSDYVDASAQLTMTADLTGDATVTIGSHVIEISDTTDAFGLPAVANRIAYDSVGDFPLTPVGLAAVLTHFINGSESPDTGVLFVSREVFCDVRAAYDGGVMTVSAVARGVAGNGIALAETLADGSWSGAELSGGADRVFLSTVLPKPVATVADVYTKQGLTGGERFRAQDSGLIYRYVGSGAYGVNFSGVTGVQDPWSGVAAGLAVEDIVFSEEDSYNGKPVYVYESDDKGAGLEDFFVVFYTGTEWVYGNLSGAFPSIKVGDSVYASAGNEDYPWDANWESGAVSPMTTHRDWQVESDKPFLSFVEQILTLDERNAAVDIVGGSFTQTVNVSNDVSAQYAETNFEDLWFDAKRGREYQYDFSIQVVDSINGNVPRSYLSLDILPWRKYIIGGAYGTYQETFAKLIGLEGAGKGGVSSTRFNMGHYSSDFDRGAYSLHSYAGELYGFLKLSGSFEAPLNDTVKPLVTTLASGLVAGVELSFRVSLTVTRIK